MAGQDEAEWDALPRTTFYPPREMAKDLAGIDVASLFRNKYLNKLDLHLSAFVRSELASVFEARRMAIGMLEVEIRRIADVEMEVLVSNGLAMTKTYEEYLAGLDEDKRFQAVAKRNAAAEDMRLELKADGVPADVIERSVAQLQVVTPVDLFGFSPFASRRVGDRYYGASLQMLPRTRAAISAFKVAMMDILATTCQRFESAGCLEPAGTRAMTEALEKILASTYPGAS
ncbi:MAG: hypothetical protein U1E73_05345 [Planctomycetota bacterium]